MNRLLMRVVTIVAAVALVYFGNKGLNAYLGKQAMSELTFAVYTLDEAMAKAGQENKLVLADYSAIWCPSCRKLSMHIFANSVIASQIKEDFIFARLDHDTEQGIAFAKTHELVGFPRVLVLTPNGEKLTEMPLTFNAFEYEANLEKVIQTYLP